MSSGSQLFQYNQSIVCALICVCVCVCAWPCDRTCVYTGTYMCTCNQHTCIHTTCTGHMGLCMWVHVCTCIHTCGCAHMYVYMHLCLSGCECTHACTCILRVGERERDEAGKCGQGENYRLLQRVQRLRNESRDGNCFAGNLCPLSGPLVIKQTSPRKGGTEGPGRLHDTSSRRAKGEYRVLTTQYVTLPTPLLLLQEERLKIFRVPECYLCSSSVSSTLSGAQRTKVSRFSPG